MTTTKQELLLIDGSWLPFGLMLGKNALLDQNLLQRTKLASVSVLWWAYWTS